LQKKGRRSISGRVRPARPAAAAARGLILAKNRSALKQPHLSVRAQKRFDDLPIPFRCVAVDLVSGNEVCSTLALWRGHARHHVHSHRIQSGGMG
jgi:predicted acylesterase/phospholipase RssA